ncbi:MAG: T9SS type A sorting domain-containing protein, partial [Bacteroidetes bacterium]
IEHQQPNSAEKGMILFPNPASDHVSVLFEPTKSGKVQIGLYDMNGTLVTAIFNGEAHKGVQQKIEFGTANLPAGTYLTRLQTTSRISEQKLVIIH